jgi:hypothetical protein
VKFKKSQGGFLEAEQGDIQMEIVPQLNASHLNKWGNVTLAVLHFAVLATGYLGARDILSSLPPAPCTPASCSTPEVPPKPLEKEA